MGNFGLEDANSQSTNVDSGPLPNGTADGQLAALESRVNELESTLKRVQADYENFVKRTEKNRKNEAEMGVISLVSDLLQVLDTFDAALDQNRRNDSAPKTHPLSPVERESLQKVREQLLRTIEQRGLKRLEALGRAFDHETMDAVASREENSAPSGNVIEVIQNGYLWNQRVLRPAKVVVAKQAHAGGEKP